MSISTPFEQQLLLAGYILGNLDAEESQAFEQLLLNDPTVQQELAQLQESLDAAYGPEVPPPPALKVSVLAAVEQAVRSLAQPSTDQVSASTTLKSTVPSDPPPTAIKFQRKILLLASGLLAALSLYLGAQNYSLQQAIETLQEEKAALEQTEVDAELVRYSLEVTENATVDEKTSTVEISVNRDRLTAVLEARGLPVLSDDRVYALWTVVPEDLPATKDAKNAILTAVFRVDQAGNQLEEIVLPGVFRDQTQIEAIAVTVESADEPQAHEASPILFRQL